MEYVPHRLRRYKALVKRLLTPIRHRYFKHLDGGLNTGGANDAAREPLLENGGALPVHVFFMSALLWEIVLVRATTARILPCEI